MKFKNLALLGLLLIILLVLTEGAHHKLSRFQHKKHTSGLSGENEVSEGQSIAEKEVQEEKNSENLSEGLSEGKNPENPKSEVVLSRSEGANSNSLNASGIPALNMTKNVSESLNKESDKAVPSQVKVNQDATKTNLANGDSTPIISEEIFGKKADMRLNTLNKLSNDTAATTSDSIVNDTNSSVANVSASEPAQNATGSAQATDSNLANNSGGVGSNDTQGGSSQNQSNQGSDGSGFQRHKVPNSGGSPNDGSSLDLLIDKDGNKYEKVEYIKNLSPYAKEELAVMRDPSRSSSYMIGKPFYIENNMTFNETPKIFSDVIDSRIWDTTRTKRDMTQYELWKNFQSKGMNEVAFKRENGEEEFEGNVIKTPETTKFEDVEIKLNKNNSVGNKQPQQDPVLEEVYNPLKKQLFEVYDNQEVSYDKRVLNGMEKSVMDTGAVVGVQETKGPDVNIEKVSVTPINKNQL